MHIPATDISGNGPTYLCSQTRNDGPNQDHPPPPRD